MRETLSTKDHDIKAALVDELEWTPTVKADQIGVAVHNGAVTLSGQVETYPQKAAARPCGTPCPWRHRSRRRNHRRDAVDL